MKALAWYVGLFTNFHETEEMFKNAVHLIFYEYIDENLSRGCLFAGIYERNLLVPRMSTGKMVIVVDEYRIKI